MVPHTMTINVMTVDDSTVLAEGLKKLFGDFPTINFKGNLSSPEDCLAALKNQDEVDVLLLDVNFPESSMNGKELATRIREAHPFIGPDGNICGPRIVFFSVNNAGYVDRDNGIFGLIPKGEDFSTIIHMIEMVYKIGATYPIKRKTAAGKRINFWDLLTKVEKKVFCGILKGKDNEQIAESFRPSLEEVGKLRADAKSKIAKMSSKTYPSLLKEVLKHQLVLHLWRSLFKNEKQIIRHLLLEKAVKKLTFSELGSLIKKASKAKLKFTEIDNPNTTKLKTKYQENLDFWETLTPKEESVLQSLLQFRKSSPKSISLNNLEKIIRAFTKTKASFHLIHDPRLVALVSALEKELVCWDELKRKEQLLLLLEADGATDEEISYALIPTISTITVHRKNILFKLRLAGLNVDKIDDPRVVKIALEQGLCDIGPIDFD